MPSNTELDALLSRVPIADLAEQFGIDQETAEAAVRQALPGLVGGMAANANDAEGAAGLERALEKHSTADAQPKLQAIDTEDGKKIVKHVLGDQGDSVAQALGSQSGNSVIADLIPKLLPILAPIVMQFLAGRVLGGGSQGASGGASGGLGGVLGDLVGGLFGGSGASSAQSAGSGSSGGDLGDLLGGLLGGGSGSGSGGLGDLLGGLLGGKK